MKIHKREIKYISVAILLIVIAIISRVETLQKNSHLTAINTGQQENIKDASSIDCNGSSDVLSALVQQPESDNSCINIGCGSFF